MKRKKLINQYGQKGCEIKVRNNEQKVQNKYVERKTKTEKVRYE